MDVVHGYITKQLPAYLQQLPLPKTLEGFQELSSEEWMQVAPVFLLIFSLMLMILLNLLPAGKPAATGRLNHKVKMDAAKVVDIVAVKGVTAKTSYCRCWQSSKVQELFKFQRARSRETLSPPPSAHPPGVHICT